MKKVILFLMIIASLTFTGCGSMLQKTNAPNAERKSDNAVPKENSQDVIIEMEAE